MTLDFPPSGSPYGPLVRLRALTPAEAASLHRGLAALAGGSLDRIAVHDLPFVRARSPPRIVGLDRSCAPGEMQW